MENQNKSISELSQDIEALEHLYNKSHESLPEEMKSLSPKFEEIQSEMVASMASTEGIEAITEMFEIVAYLQGRGYKL